MAIFNYNKLWCGETNDVRNVRAKGTSSRHKNTANYECRWNDNTLVNEWSIKIRNECVRNGSRALVSIADKTKKLWEVRWFGICLEERWIKTMMRVDVEEKSERWRPKN